MFNLNDDISEVINIADSQPLKVKSLARKLGRYLRKVDAQRPIIKETGATAPWPGQVHLKN